MTDKNPYQAVLRSRIAAAIGEARAASSLTHPGLKGTILEILIGKLFKPLLPSDVGVGTGQIINAHNAAVSGQVDIVIYDQSILPPVLIDEKTGIFPIEAVLFAIEVKTKLTATELSKAHDAAKLLDTEFKYLPGLRDFYGKVVNHPFGKVESVILALESDLVENGLDEAKRYQSIYGDGEPFVRAICVAGRGHWSFRQNKWFRFKGDDQFDEVLLFIGAIMNTYKTLALSRQYPKLGKYITPNGSATEC
jgi:hypothetical protein